MNESHKQYPNNRFENWIAYRDSETFKSGIRTLERLSINLQNKVVILATALNVKKASQIEFTDEISKKDFETMLSDLGLFFLM